MLIAESPYKVKPIETRNLNTNITHLLNPCFTALTTSTNVGDTWGKYLAEAINKVSTISAKDRNLPVKILILAHDTAILGDEYILNSHSTKASLARFIDACNNLNKHFPNFSIKIVCTITSRLPLAPYSDSSSSQAANVGYVAELFRSSLGDKVNFELVNNTRHNMDFSLWSWVSHIIPTIEVNLCKRVILSYTCKIMID